MSWISFEVSSRLAELIAETNISMAAPSFSLIVEEDVKALREFVEIKRMLRHDHELVSGSSSITLVLQPDSDNNIDRLIEALCSQREDDRAPE